MISTDWPRAARAIAAATEDAVAAAQAHAVDDYRASVADLDAEDPSQVGAVHAEMVRVLLEELHPDGLTGEDVQDVLTRTVRTSDVWMGVSGSSTGPAGPSVEGFVEVLTGALGVADVEGPRSRPRAGHAVLVIAELVAARRGQDAAVSAREYVLRAIGEIERAQTMEMP